MQEIEKIYNKKLKEIEKIVGDKTTYLSDLDKAGIKLIGKKFKGVYPSDLIPKLTNNKCCCILNLDKSGQPGTHWIAIYKFGNKTLCYDSFGRRNTQIITNLKFSGNGKIYDTERDEEQKIMETNCGARCLSFLWCCKNYGFDLAKNI